MRVMATTLYIFRHGQVEEAFQGKFIGNTDAPLNGEGREQMARFVPFVREHHGSRIFYSPLKRARESFQITTEGKALHASADDDLREINFGSWENKNFLEIQKTYPEAYRDWQRFSPGFAYPGGGETHTGLIRRVKRVARRIKDEKSETVLVFTHGGTALFLICELLGLGPSAYRLFFVNRGSRSMVDLSRRPGVLRELNYC
jgi:broad specificity phosphatase PhoE